MALPHLAPGMATSRNGETVPDNPSDEPIL
jgi:hypothetical protein